MKKYIAIVLAAVMLLGIFTGCGKENDNPDMASTPTGAITSPTEKGPEETMAESAPIETEPIETEPIETEPTISLPDYKLVQIGSDSKVSDSQWGIAKTGLDTEDGEGKTYYALSWVFEEAEWTQEYHGYVAKLKDKATGELIDKDGDHARYVYYQSTIFDTEEVSKSEIYTDCPSKRILTVVLYSDYEIKYEDVEIGVKYKDVYYALEANAELSDITSSPKRAEGYMFIKLTDSYYVADSSSYGSGGNGEDTDYTIFDFISVQNPLSSLDRTEPIIDAAKITFYDMETGEQLPAVPGTKLYYAEQADDGSTDVCIGVMESDAETVRSWYERYRVFYDGTCLYA